MASFITESEIEKDLLQHLQHVYGYDTLNAFTADREDLNDGSGRTDKSDVIFQHHLRDAVIALNPEIPATVIDEALRKLCAPRRAMSLVAANQEIDGLIRDGVRVQFKDGKGRNRRELIRIIDFDHPEKNQFLAVTQLWIQGEHRYRRPDILLYVNGLPLVFIELKNSNIKLKSAYDDNLTNYKADIPQLFRTNAFCVLSNGIDTRVGSLTSQWEHFFRWLRPDDEKEKIRHDEISAEGSSVERFLAGLCGKERLLDYLENFVIYHKGRQKIVAQNHQFIGVNKGYRKFLQREDLGGRLGVFWHTQGSGKSFSMIFYTRKIFRKCKGNYSFVVITDREDLDGQIYRNFLHTGTVRKADAAQPKNSEEMRAYLGQNKRLVFTLIQKFRWPAGQDYPLLSDREDIIVIVDEAHRSQYETLAENMRAGLPNAQYLAFTGTPLLGKGRKTNRWFGDYVSEYNFSQSMNDGATVPLFYKKRVPEMHNQNNDLSEEFVEIVENEDLSEAQQEKLENQFANEIAIIKRDDRLDAIAKDIVYHFTRRGYLGKGMVITVDKIAAVKMYDKVQRFWKEEIKALRGQIGTSGDEIRKARLKRMIQYMHRVEMAVVVSHENGEEEKFEKEELDIRIHRKRLDSVDENGHDLEYKFKNPEDPLQLVFVCAKWIVGFDAPTVSTLYLDKPQKDHSLMQTIARANRVSAFKIDGVEKSNGEVIDYFGVFARLKKAIRDYGNGEEGDDSPIQDKEELFRLLNEAIEQGRVFCESKGIQIDQALDNGDTFEKIELFGEWANILLRRDEYRKSFRVYQNTIATLYQASKPDILGHPVARTVALFQYLRGVIDSVIEQEDIGAATRKVNELLDESLIVDESGHSEVKQHGAPYKILPEGKTWDLSQIDFDKLESDFKAKAYKNIEITNLRAFLEKKLGEMLSRNRTRRDFAERLQQIIENYNAGSSSVDADFEELIRFARDLKDEEERHIRLGLTEDELEIYDLLCKKRMSKAEEKKVRLAAKALLKRLIESHPKILIQDWYKERQTRLTVRDEVESVLDEYLPEESYDKTLFLEKRDQIFDLVLDLAINQRKWAA